jgi:hypothetical protein
MGMVWNQCPCETLCFRIKECLSKPLQEVGLICVFPKNLLPLDASYNDVMECSWSINPRFSGHVPTIAQPPK